MRFLSADRIFSGKEYLPGDTVLVLEENGNIRDFVPAGSLEKDKIECLEGVLSPGFVNSHCHLELSHLKSQIPEGTGLPGFVMEVVKRRGKFDAVMIQEAIEAADKEMWEGGIVAVGDISNSSDSFKCKEKSKICYHTFVELIGLKPESADQIFQKGKELTDLLKASGLSGSLAPHAPYSTSKELIAQIARFDEHNGLPFSIHNQESTEETKFFAGEQNGFMNLYDFLNLDISWFRAPGISSLGYYGAKVPDKKTILVHNTFTELPDLSVVNGKEIFWCFCPRANKYIEDKLPDFSIFKADNICIGTDSYASNHTLNVTEEVNLILSQNKHFSTEDLLSAITYNGARALALDHKFGQLEKGRNAGLNLLKIQDEKIHFVKKIT